ncbi:MAG: SPOR domain-containing protein [Gammaproteobacteria bacterium]|nr:SPOR domain-containing protein [Gammaproteobacteria bacterium]NND58872.1 SPOR domain-containing protein [Gammaproteobacteria bacterium]
MPRDYKNSRRRKKESTPGWVWGLGGLGLGLAVALAVHLRQSTAVEPALPAPDTSAIPSSAREVPADEEPESRFDFYDMLPRFEVVIPETEREVGSNDEGTARAEDQAGDSVYILQAGSFRNFNDADRMKAQLALLGMESQIQNVTIDDNRWHRVRLGPFASFTEAQRARRRLRESRVDALILRVAE